MKIHCVIITLCMAFKLIELSKSFASFYYCLKFVLIFMFKWEKKRRPLLIISISRHAVYKELIGKASSKWPEAKKFKLLHTQRVVCGDKLSPKVQRRQKSTNNFNRPELIFWHSNVSFTISYTSNYIRFYTSKVMISLHVFLFYIDNYC